MSNDWDVAENNGTVFMPSRWASVKDNIWDVSNWKISNNKTSLKEHKLP